MSTKPNFFIVGAPKCGTTAMHSYLRQHPEIYMPIEKEPYYFHVQSSTPTYLRFRGNLDKYLELFQDVTSETMIGEASPSYLYSEAATQEIYEFDPNAKIIIMLREPIDMMSSLFQHRSFMGDEQSESLEDAIHRELTSNVALPESYIQRVKYSKHVKRYIDTFGKSQVHIIIFDDVRNNLVEIYRKTLVFLGVDPTFQAEFEIVNSSKAVRNTPIHQLMQSLNLTPKTLRDSALFHKITRWMPQWLYRQIIDIGVRFYTQPQKKTGYISRFKSRSTGYIATGY